MADIITPKVENIITGSLCSFRSDILICIAPANSRKFNIHPIKISVKSNSLINEAISFKGLEVKLPKRTKIIDIINAMIIIPMVEGNFKNLTLMYEKIAAKIIRIENE